jgi:hypothetical protein
MVYLQITLKIAHANRPAAADVYQRYKAPFLKTIAGAKSKELIDFALAPRRWHYGSSHHWVHPVAYRH